MKTITQRPSARSNELSVAAAWAAMIIVCPNIAQDCLPVGDPVLSQRRGWAALFRAVLLAVPTALCLAGGAVLLRLPARWAALAVN